MKRTNTSLFAVPIYRSAFCGARSKIGSGVANGSDANSIALDVLAMSLRLKDKAGQQANRQSDEPPFFASDSWAYRVGKWKAVDAIRKELVRRSHVPLLSKNIEDATNLPEDCAMTSEEQRIVQQGLLSLQFQDAVYLFCRYWLGFSNHEVAEFWTELTGECLSERAHGLRFKNASDRLRRKLEPLKC